MDEALKRQVRLRAKNRCEYCQLPQVVMPVPFQVDHIIAIQHRGQTVASNLALACFDCNSHKGPNLAGIDPMRRTRIVRLFNPRRHKWARHFRWDGAVLLGRTAIGRTTIEVLGINLEHRILLREELIANGDFPPD